MWWRLVHCFYSLIHILLTTCYCRKIYLLNESEAKLYYIFCLKNDCFVRIHVCVCACVSDLCSQKLKSFFFINLLRFPQLIKTFYFTKMKNGSITTATMQFDLLAICWFTRNEKIKNKNTRTPCFLSVTFHDL